MTKTKCTCEADNWEFGLITIICWWCSRFWIASMFYFSLSCCCFFFTYFIVPNNLSAHTWTKNIQQGWFWNLLLIRCVSSFWIIKVTKRLTDGHSSGLKHWNIFFDNFLEILCTKTHTQNIDYRKSWTEILVSKTGLMRKWHKAAFWLHSAHTDCESWLLIISHV